MEIIVPTMPANTPKEQYIYRCNRYMADHSRALISFVAARCGDAFDAINYSKKKDSMRIFNLAYWVDI